MIGARPGGVCVRRRHVAVAALAGAAPARDDSRFVAWLDLEVNPARTALRALETIRLPVEVSVGKFVERLRT
jgi:hypothetical protein